MVSVQEPISPSKRRRIQLIENSSNKRKWGGREGDDQSFNNKGLLNPTKADEGIIKNTKSNSDVGQLNLKSFLPQEWEKCLDIKPEQIHVYNSTRTQERTCSEDQRESPEKLSLGPMSLELELNLPCQSLRTRVNDNWTTKHDNSDSFSLDSNTISTTTTTKKPSKEINNSHSLSHCSSWISFYEDQEEMVAAVCMRCHMLVILCKAIPSCPNCKFMHPPDQSPVNYKPLVPCKD